MDANPPCSLDSIYAPHINIQKNQVIHMPRPKQVLPAAVSVRAEFLFRIRLYQFS